MELVLSFAMGVYDTVNENAVLFVSTLIFIYFLRTGKKLERENELYKQRIWDDLSENNKSFEQNILWFLVSNTEKLERQAMYMRGTMAASIAIFVLLLFKSM